MSREIEQAKRAASLHKGTPLERAYNALACMYESILDDSRPIYWDGILFTDDPYDYSDVSVRTRLPEDV